MFLLSIVLDTFAFSDSDSWVAIDPKGIVGEIEFEAAAFDFIYESELNNLDVPGLFEQRTKLFADRLNLNHQRLKDWVFVRLVLGVCWIIEDGGDPYQFLHRIALVY